MRGRYPSQATKKSRKTTPKKRPVVRRLAAPKVRLLQKGAYSSKGTSAQIRAEKVAIATRGRAAGFRANAADVNATFQRNLARLKKRAAGGSIGVPKRAARAGGYSKATVSKRAVVGVRKAANPRTAGVRGARFGVKIGTFGNRKGKWKKGQGGRFVGSG